MATLKPCVKNDFVKSDGKCNIKIRLSHDGKVRYLKTPYYIEPNLLGRDGRIKQRHPNYIELNTTLTKLQDEYNSIIAGIGPDIRYMAITTLMNKLRRNESNGASFLIYANQRIKEFYEDYSYTHFKTVTHNINDRLALIGDSHGIADLTTYYARYTWSTIASSIGILQDTISHSLGHVQNETTEGYINYDLNLIDTVNLKVIQAISCRTE